MKQVTQLTIHIKKKITVNVFLNEFGISECVLILAFCNAMNSIRLWERGPVVWANQAPLQCTCEQSEQNDDLIHLLPLLYCPVSKWRYVPDQALPLSQWRSRGQLCCPTGLYGSQIRQDWITVPPPIQFLYLGCFLAVLKQVFSSRKEEWSILYKTP